MVKIYFTLVWIIAFGLESVEAEIISAPPELKPCGQFLAMQAVAGDKLVSANGETLVLAGVKAPELWPADSPYKSWPFAVQSRDRLNAMAKGTTLALFCEGESTTLEGAQIAHAQLPDGQWLQHDMVAAGLVMVFPRADHLSGVQHLYAIEDIARSETRGLWRAADVSSASDGTIQTGWFKIVNGTVISAAQVQDRVYLNFGTDWRKDFTVEIPARTMRQFRKTGVDPLTLSSMMIEVRGWVDWKGGPHILLESPGHLRLLHPKTDTAPEPQAN